MTDPATPPRKRRRKRPEARAEARAAARPAPRSPGTRQPRQLVTLAAAGMLLGVALTATGGLGGGLGGLLTLLGPWVSVLSMALAIGAAHTLGRTGPDPGIFPPAAEAPDEGPDPGGLAS